MNNRIEIFDQDGHFETEWKQFGRPSGIFITPDDTLYVADSESATNAPNVVADTGLRKGLRWGDAKTGIVKGFIEDAEASTNEPSGAEVVSADRDGNIYGGVVRRQALERFVKR